MITMASVVQGSDTQGVPQELWDALGEALTAPRPSKPDESLFNMPSASEMYGGYIAETRDGGLMMGGKPVTKLYRVVDPGEWAEAQRNGYLQSRGGYTRASAQPDERWRRQGPSNVPGYTLEIDFDRADGWHASAEGYAATHSRIPLSRVRRI